MNAHVQFFLCVCVMRLRIRIYLKYLASSFGRKCARYENADNKFRFRWHLTSKIHLRHLNGFMLKPIFSIQNWAEHTDSEGTSQWVSAVREREKEKRRTTMHVWIVSDCLSVGWFDIGKFHEQQHNRKRENVIEHFGLCLAVPISRWNERYRERTGEQASESEWKIQRQTEVKEGKSE